MFLQIVILLIVLILWLMGRKKIPNSIKEAPRKENPLCFLYPLSYLLYRKWQESGVWEAGNPEDKLRRELRFICVKSKEELKQMEILCRCRQISWVLLFLILAAVLTLVLQIKIEAEGKQVEIVRNESGQGEMEQSISLKNGKEQMQYKQVVSDQKYTKEQAVLKIEEARKYVDTAMLGKNESYDCITKALVFAERAPDNAVEITYHPEDGTLIDSKGQIQAAELGSNGVFTQVRVEFLYEEQQQETNYPMRLYPPEKSELEKQWENVQKAITGLEESTRMQKSFELPESIEGVLVSLPGQAGDQRIIAVIFCLVLAVLFCFREGEQRKKQRKDRDEQLLRDYPTFVNQLVLLVGAGMTLKAGIWKLALDYQEKKLPSDPESNVHYLYEELLAAVHEMEMGVPESRAYQNLGMRLKLRPYFKLTTLLIQNLTKGAANLTAMLEQEELEAFETRKELAKRLGEEAGTKLLMPMFLLLLVVLLLIMYPAVVNFRM